MEIVLHRTYLLKATNGVLTLNGRHICHTIELPWRDNLPRSSCIPEGRYTLAKRYSPKFKWHLEIESVPNRSLILFHPANDALRELKGCIAPVTQLLGAGTGALSRKAVDVLYNVVSACLDTKQIVYLTIKS